MFRSILSCLRDDILLRAPFLAGAFNALFFEQEAGTILPRTDGAHFYMDPEAIREAFLKDECRLRYALIHIQAHIQLGHLTGRCSKASDIACDILAARYVSALDPALIPPAMRAPLEAVQRACAALSDPLTITEALNESFVPDQIENFATAIRADDHSRWHEAVMPLPNVPYTLAGGNMNGSRRRGSGGGGRQLDIQLTENEHTSLGVALSRYTILGETPRPDPGTFQLPLYLYSLDTVGAALIEENEFTEERKLSSFVIAIDTSGSCEEDLTRRFLEITRDILLKEHLFFRRFELRIMQCDDRIRSDQLITSEADFENYIETLKVYGGGGTDFTPVFERIETRRRALELPHLRGVLYFSDGKGIFPSNRPDYGVTFAFPNEGCDLIDVPEWVERVFF